MKTIGIIGGTGAMGSLFKKFFKNSGFKVLVSGRKTKLFSKEICAQSDWVIFCVPIPATLQAIRQNARFARKGAIVSDFTSIKEEPLKAMLKHSPKDCSVLGIHPLFGPSVKSLKGQKIALIKGRGNEGFYFVKRFFESHGSSVIECNAREHDELMGIIQGANHFDNLAFALFLTNSRMKIQELESFSTPNFSLKLSLVARILKQNPKLYADLILENKPALKNIRALAESFKYLEKIVKRKDSKKLQKELDRISRKFGKSTTALFEQSDKALLAFSK